MTNRSYTQPSGAATADSGETRPEIPAYSAAKAASTRNSKPIEAILRSISSIAPRLE